MTYVDSGTPEAHSNHSIGTAFFGTLIAYGIPVAIGIFGIGRFGWDAISWKAAMASGALAAFVFLLVGLAGNAIGLTHMDMLDLLGSMFAKPHSSSSRKVGFVLHHLDGALLGAAWVYGLLFLKIPAGWISGLTWGIILWVLSLLLMTSIGGVHPAIRKHLEEDPGPAAINFGIMTPLGTLVGHAVFGIVLGLLYQHWRL